MKDKYKVLITIAIITILLIIYLIILLTSNNRIKPNELTTVTTTSSSTTVETTTTTTTEEVTTTNTTVVATTTTKKTTSSTTTTSTTVKPITYSCPNNYVLENNKCIRKVAATLQCPSGYTSYKDDTKCINLSAGYEINENDTCPDGYDYMMQLSLFGPNTYKCHPVKDPIYVCNEGTLKNNECIISIDAIAN